MKIAVGSVNEDKILAVRDAIKMAYLPFNLEVIGSQERSGVSEQPQDLTEIHMGARNRALGALKHVPEARFAVGIEQGLHLWPNFNVYPHQEHLVDLAVVVLLDREVPKKFRLQQAVVTTSTGIPCPEKAVHQALAFPRVKTVGECISQRTHGRVSASNWHEAHTGGRLSRTAILAQAVLAALSVYCVSRVDEEERTASRSAKEERT